MSEKVVIISSSLRRNSNSHAFEAGAKAAGKTVTFISLADKSIAFCKGCLACQRCGACVIKDDAVAIAEAMRQADSIVFSTPIYYYEMSGQLKTLLDRANSLYASDYAFRKIYFLSTAAEDAPVVDERAIHGLEGWIECFEKCRLCGSVFAGGVDEPGAIEGHAALEAATVWAQRHNLPDTARSAPLKFADRRKGFFKDFNQHLRPAVTSGFPQCTTQCPPVRIQPGKIPRRF